MKKIFLIGVYLFLGIMGSEFSHAAKGISATNEDISALKTALRGGIIQIGKTRLNDIREVYGEATEITEDEQRVVYDYGDIRLEFVKQKKWKYWEYDTFKKAVYTDDVDDLRFDLEADEIVGDNVSFRNIRRKYGEPTESYETEEDGKMSIFYYGDIKLVFENVFVVRSWRGTVGAALQDGGASSGGVLGTQPTSGSN